MKNQKSVRVTREVLYQQVWETPMRKLAAHYNISDRGLAKICKRLTIPTPGRGYWAKKAAGKHVIQYQLPEPDKNTPIDVVITEHGGMPKLNPEIQDSLSKAIEGKNEHAIPKRLISPHPIIRQWLNDYDERKKEEREKKRRDPFGHRFSAMYRVKPLTSIDRRRHRILNVLFNEVEKQGYEVKSERYDVAYLEFDNIRVDFVLREKLKQVKRPLTKEEKAFVLYNDKPWIQELEPTGKLHFSIKTHIKSGLRQEWNDTEKKTLEGYLPSIIETFKVAGTILVENRREREEEERLYREKEHQRRMQEDALRKEQNQWRRFLEFSQTWQEVKQAREFILAIEEKVTDPNQRVGDRTMQEWLTWARDNMEKYDPLSNEMDAIFSALSKVKLYTY